ncbi:Uncharacterized protein DAT39_020380, partial [Clarias magur]
LIQPSDLKHCRVPPLWGKTIRLNGFPFITSKPTLVSRVTASLFTYLCSTE